MKDKKVSIYDFEVADNKGVVHSLSEFKGKILLIVNSAIHCTFADTYKELQKTYRKYHSQGFEILDFPCDQFHGQSSESDGEIEKYCEENYQTTFMRFKKIDVNGFSASPLFLYLAKKKKFKGFDKGEPIAGVIASIHIKEDPLWETKSDIKWNFTKFLVDRNGEIKKRFECTSKEKDIDKAIEYLLDHQL